MTEKKDIASMLPMELQSEMTAMGIASYRALQIFKWLSIGITEFSKMTNLPLSLRNDLADRYSIPAPSVEARQTAEDGTVKYLWRLTDGNCVESVFMRYKYGNSICISTQAGCAMGCAFCASCRNGLVRNLTASEILLQVVSAAADTGESISHIVLMGTGEPLANYDNVLRFLRLVNAPEGMNIGQRNISLSTCGLCDQIDRLAEEELQITLSISLHAGTDEVRSRLMPVNRLYPLKRLMSSCGEYFRHTGRRISYEYAMINGVNDTEEELHALTGMLRHTNSHVNLIALNRVSESPFEPSTQVRIDRFRDHLIQNGITATVRRKLGEGIDAACGQLRLNRS